MAEPFLAEIKIIGFNFAPRGFAQCDGQLLPINQYQSLYSLMGTTYGGDGRTTFALPDLRGRTPIHEGFSPGTNTHPLGQKGGEEAHSLSIQEMPAHCHGGIGTSQTADDDTPGTDMLPALAEKNTYRTGDSTVSVSMAPTTATGMNQGHNNMQPYMVLNYIIALQGIFPSRN